MITAHPNAAEGSVLTLSSYSPSDFPAGSVILCRNTAPLVSFAFSLLRRRVSCSVRGKDIGARLVSILRRLRAPDLPELLVRLGQWRAERLARDPRSEATTEDQFQSLMWVIADVGMEAKVSDVLSKIDSLFSDSASGAGVLLSTIHKSKGLEWPTVFLLDRDVYYPNKRAVLPWQREQEKNLLYVALTRASERLIYISSNRWKE